MRLTSDQARERFMGSPVARLATVSASGCPHLVPIVFVVIGDVIYTGVDGKPKTTTALKRLANIETNSAVSVLVDHYSDDWEQLWWARADGEARIVDGDEVRTAQRELVARYRAYATMPPPEPLIAIEVTRWSGWCAT